MSEDTPSNVYTNLKLKDELDNIDREPLELHVRRKKKHDLLLDKKEYLNILINLWEMKDIYDMNPEDLKKFISEEEEREYFVNKLGCANKKTLVCRDRYGQKEEEYGDSLAQRRLQIRKDLNRMEKQIKIAMDSIGYNAPQGGEKEERKENRVKAVEVKKIPPRRKQKSKHRRTKRR